ncbi:hypothetical protein SAMN04488028_104306 [Reichenbachiella agariperforans]|uniref:Uncharacterized protein n=1 Tax=Reichenbachiella agariperforans TaxID=156994 RepID=A0A1M6RV94_REIAG|nr:hypothetical protein [Reichenbachiella agariperforans]SHK36442.1 hypothetical protein SAMN04488028_104306 [Reichenbachiella agariperforans]
MSEVRFIIRYTGGNAENHKLDLYDAATSIHGLAKALAITTHALVTEGEIRSKGGSIPDVNFFLHPPQKGSFVEIVTIAFEDPAVKVIGASVLTSVFWDMLNYTWKIASGKNATPTQRIPKKILAKNDTFPQEIADVLEKSLQQIHRPILHDNNIKIEVKRPKKGVVIEFNRETLNHVYLQDEPQIQDNISGNVTKYNILSGYGRFYDDVNQKTIPFNLGSDIISQDKEVLTTSLSDASKGDGGKILLRAKVINDRTGHVKRYIIENARKNNDSGLQAIQ